MLYQKLALVGGVLALASTIVSARDWNTEAREPFHYSFSNDKTLDVDNVNGEIRITGDGGNTIRVEGERIIHARDKQAADRAKKDVTLDVNERDGTAQLFVNGPFRGNNGHWSDYHGFHSRYDGDEYEVDYNFNIHLPRDTQLQLRTVNGTIRTDQTSGRFDISGVNGDIGMTAAAGSGRLNMVNGRMDAAFREGPKSDTEFHSVNGAIEVTFPPNLSADLVLKTLNGQAYTDFDATALANAFSQDRRGRFVYRPDHNAHVRIGSGGPEIRFQTVNGDIRIKKAK
jgi:hypothetical protein